MTLKPDNSWGGDEFTLKVHCPICFNQDYVHMVDVAVNQGGDTTIVEYGGARLEERPASGRGSLVTVRMVCESSHLFALEFQFHKGQTFARTVQLGTVEQFPSTLWRD